MIFVDARPFAGPDSQSQGRETLASLLDHPTLIAASNRLKATPETKVSRSSDHSKPAFAFKHVYVFQKEYATVDPALVEFVGTDEATTCAGLVIRNRESGMTSVAHMDFPEVVDMGLTQMLSLIVGDEVDATLDVYVIGAFEDASYEHVNRTTRRREHGKEDGYSLPLCSKIIEALQNRQEHFHIQTLCVLGNNTKSDSQGNATPIIGGFLASTSSGLIVPASFDRTSRCPDEIVRRVRVSVCFADPHWRGKLLETYNTRLDRFQIAPCSWISDWGEFAYSMQQLSDSEILLKCSTSPLAESPDFVENERRLWSYLIKHPDCEQTFVGRKPRIFQRTTDGEWLSEGRPTICLNRRFGFSVDKSH